MTKNELSSAKASYMRYIPGAGGGKGILFKVHPEKPLQDFTLNRFVVNDVEIPATYEDSLIVASMFYADPEPSMDDPNPEPTDAVLFRQTEFKAVIYFTTQGKSDSVLVNNFMEEEQPLYP